MPCIEMVALPAFTAARNRLPTSASRPSWFCSAAGADGLSALAWLTRSSSCAWFRSRTLTSDVEIGFARTHHSLSAAEVPAGMADADVGNGDDVVDGNRSTLVVGDSAAVV